MIKVGDVNFPVHNIHVCLESTKTRYRKLGYYRTLKPSYLYIKNRSQLMEASILLHLEDLSFSYPIIARKTGVVALLSYSNCFTTPTLVDNYWTPVGINGQSYCHLSFQLCTVNHTVVTKNKHIIIAKCLLQ